MLKRQQVSESDNSQTLDPVVKEALGAFAGHLLKDDEIKEKDEDFFS